MECLFCRIAKKEMSAHVVYEDRNAIAFLDIHPRAPGHTVVIPKVHAETILDMAEKGGTGVWKAVKAVTKMLSHAFSPDGFTIGINHGRASGQAVDHLHVHVLPRWHGDGGRSLHSVVDNPPKESLGEIADRLMKGAQDATRTHA